MQTRICGLALVASLTFCAGTFAAEPIETISVIGARQPIELSRLSASVSILDRQLIALSGALSLSDLLRTQAGLHFSQDGGRGAQTQLRLRGSEANHVLVLIDGVVINDLSDGGVNFAHLSLDNVERIEILRGPQSALWGSGALSGVINISTSGANQQAGADLKAEVGQNHSQLFSARGQGRMGTVSYRAALSHAASDGQNISRAGNEADGFRNNTLMAGLDWQMSDWSSLSVQVRHQDTYNEFDETDWLSGLPTDSNAYSHGIQQSGKLAWQLTPDDSLWRHQLGLQYQRHESDHYRPAVVEASQFELTSTETQMLRLVWQSDLHYGQGSRASVAVERVEEDFRQQAQATPWGDPNQQQENHTQSAILDWVYALTEQLTWQASVRQDNNQVFADATTYRIGLSYQPRPRYLVFASHGKAIKNPTFIERYGYTPDQFIGNPRLRPEQALTTELGIQFDWQGWNSQFSVYDSRLTDEINGYVFDIQQGAATAINLAGNSERRGLEWHLAGHWLTTDIAFNYSYLEASEGDQKSPEVRRPRHAANLTLSRAMWDDRANLYLQVNYLGSRQDVFFPAPSYQSTLVALPAATVVNAAFHYRLDSQWQLSVRADNLLDNDYEELLGYRRQGRTLYLGAQWHY